MPKFIALSSAALAVSLSALAAAAPATAQTQGHYAGDQSLPDVLSPAQRTHYRQLFAALRDQNWPRVEELLDKGEMKPLNNFARAEYYLAANSPKVELDAVMSLLARQPDLPQGQQLARLAQKRGAVSLPLLPAEQSFRYLGEAPRRVFNIASIPDPVAAGISAQILTFIKNDDPMSGEALLNANLAAMSRDAQTEWQYRLAWSYYIENDDANARRMAESALAGTGPWVAQAHWAAGLIAWRQGDYPTAAQRFDRIAALTNDAELEAAGLYWTARALIASGQPQGVNARLKTASRMGETFYGLLAGEALGVVDSNANRPDRSAWKQVKDHDNVRLAIALAEIDEDKRADDTLRFQARCGGAQDYKAILSIARLLSLPSTQMYLAHYGPSGQQADKYARYPAPDWQPQGGWRVDKALVYAHALQESQFRTAVISPAGAEGLMQVRPGTARDIAAKRGAYLAPGDLSKPSVNMEYGQSYMEYLRDNGATGGLLPKVIAAYNAGPNPVARWNTEIRDKGDPLLFIESIPYWETRGYVGIVLRNYWMYQQQAGQSSRSMADMAQGKWPAFPTERNSANARLTYNDRQTGGSN